MRRSIVLPYVRAVERLGCTVDDISHTGKNHIRLTVRHGNGEGGRKHAFVIGGTPSDWMALTAFRANVRRWVRTGASP